MMNALWERLDGAILARIRDRLPGSVRIGRFHRAVAHGIGAAEPRAVAPVALCGIRGRFRCAMTAEQQREEKRDRMTREKTGMSHGGDAITMDGCASPRGHPRPKFPGIGAKLT